jgi:hypothetical protein
MIQRIQSVWLLLSAACSTILLFNPEVYSGTASDGVTKIFSVTESSLLMFLLGINSVLPFVTIFLFKNRKRQKKNILINLITVAVFIGVQKYLTGEFTNQFGLQQGHWQYFAILPFFSILFLALAFIGIRKDEKLLSESNRMR